MTDFNHVMRDLTQAQAEAVKWDKGAMLVLAGPGSGKTRVLTTRVARILNDSAEKSFRVLALTFTNIAANEMVERIEEYVPEQQERATIGTFHSFCMQMLQQHGSHIGINPNFAIYSLQSDRVDLLNDAARGAGLQIEPESFLRSIDQLKSRLITPENSVNHFRDRDVAHRVATIFTAYEEALAKANALDFNSLIARTYELITKNPGVGIHYRRAYPYWMFDEFQDTTSGQYRLIKALAGTDFKNVFAVADDDQIIYQWNGASYQQIQRFRTDFEPTEIQLPTNYRCPPRIVSAANELVAHNLLRTTTKQPLAAGRAEVQFTEDQQIQVVRFKDEDQEASGIAAGIAKMGQNRWDHVAVLARTRALLERVQNALSEEGVPSVIAQRRDEFRSPPFQWLVAALGLAMRPLDKRALEALCGAFNRWQDAELEADTIAASADISSQSLLVEWANVGREADGDLATQLADLAMALAKDPTGFRTFIGQFLVLVPSDDEENGPDIEEDRAAWSALSRQIRQAIGRDAPLEQFLQEMSLRSKEPPISPATVTLMTIHGAKGKEFDYVYLIGLAESVLPSFQSIKAGEDSPEMEEERRNCFVAITRAREWLCLSFAESYRGWRKQPSRFLAEMGLVL